MVRAANSISDAEQLEHGLRVRRRALAHRVAELREEVGVAVAKAWPRSCDDAPLADLEEAQRELLAAECALEALPLLDRLREVVRDEGALAELNADQHREVRRLVKTMDAELPADDGALHGLAAMDRAREVANVMWRDASHALPDGILVRLRAELERRLPSWTPDTAEEVSI